MEISGSKSRKGVPQRLKPHSGCDVYGTAEAVPFVQRIFPQPKLFDALTMQSEGQKRC